MKDSRFPAAAVQAIFALSRLVPFLLEENMRTALSIKKHSDLKALVELHFMLCRGFCVNVVSLLSPIPAPRMQQLQNSHDDVVKKLDPATSASACTLDKVRPPL